MSFEVKALETVFTKDLRRIKEGGRFFIDSLREFEPSSMEFVDEKNVALYEQKADLILEERQKIHEETKAASESSETGKFKKVTDTVPGAGPKAKAGKKEAPKKADSGKHDVI